MAITVAEPEPEELSAVMDALRDWQHDGSPMQLHPGDVGWYWRFGAAATAAALRTWNRQGRILAVGLLDGPKLLRLTTAPDARRDEELARQVLADVTHPERDVLAAGEAYIEAPADALLHDLLLQHGWNFDEPWTPLRRDLGQPVADPGVEIEVAEPAQVHVRTAVHRASFDVATFTDERWQTMASGPAYADARCLIAYDDAGEAVAAATVWSAGPGVPGVLEPLGVHREHRGHGYGTAISLAAARTLRDLGSSSALVNTPSSNVTAVAAYASAGFQPQPSNFDLRR